MEIFTKWSSSFSSSYLFVLYFYINLLLITIDCAWNGMISPIEVVEEWACHNTEIRLTCRNIESKIAILEATFTPNCTANDDTCEHLNSDKIKLLVARHKLDPQLAQQTEAGRRFLEALRLQDEAEQVSPPPDVETVIAPKEKRNSLRASLERLIVKYLRKITSDEDDDIEDTSERRNRRNLNNATFLDTTDSDYGGGTSTEQGSAKYRASDVIKPESDVDSNIIDGYDDDGLDENDEVELDEEENENGFNENLDGNKIKNSMWNGDLMCSEKKRRITQLDRFELQKSIENESDNEFNIRNVLNYRCSGKNLCSFVFAADHPYTAVWNSGLVHIKYICMDSYRTNKYCNEHLTIGNEVPMDGEDESQPTHEQYIEIHSRRRHVTREEPHAEALTQSENRNQQNFHQLHNLKILKPSESETEDLTDAELDKLKREHERNRKLKHRQGVYSQDFRILKVLPNNIDQFNDIEQIGDEFYFKKDDANDFTTVGPPPQSTLSDTESVIVPANNENNVSPDDSDFHAVPEIFVKTVHSLDDVGSTVASQIEKSNEVDSNEEDMFDEEDESLEEDDGGHGFHTEDDEYEHWNATTDYKIMIREGEEVITNYPELKTKVSQPMSSQQSTELGMLQIQMNTSFDWENEVFVRRPNQSTEDPEEKVEEAKFIKRIKESFQQSVTNGTETSTAGQLHTKSGGADDDDDVEFENNGTGDDDRKNEKFSKHFDYTDIDDSDEDYDDSYEKQLKEDESYEAEDGYRKLRNRKYKSIQRTSLSQPLVQGFAMSPGYPKFYIGNTECNWKIIAPRDQRIKITILDLDLRYDDLCKDKLEIVDLKIKRVLFSSCSEIEKPKQIISDSNNIEIKLTTKTNVAYPKRGVLIHYSALGCILPVLPAHVRLVDRTENIASYRCVKNFVFPDTTLDERELYCTLRHSWSNKLPDCIDNSEIVGSGLVTRFEHNRKDPPVTMAGKEADTVFDIVIPSILILGLLAVNAVIFAVIMHYRNKRKESLDIESKELAEL